MNRSHLFLIFLLCHISIFSLHSQAIPDTSILRLIAPDTFQAVFYTTKGEITIEAYRNWSPLGVDRLYQLISSGFYSDNCIFRVQPEYVVQFGISDHSGANFFWERRPVADEPVVGHNLKGAVSYARDGANSRTAQLFINMKDNFKLDTVNYKGLQGFPPVAMIIGGFEVVEAFNDTYGFEPANHQDSAMVQGNACWEKNFPGLDYIREARLIRED
ncbi:MAG: peptidylprolyl isomerase [Bacteroidales bacterium]|jgi:cyclophilin family peptidyl-prolyl cis-trans isomerase|nr:peptidylprolyl isomerase [Bacteroidales bacterium]